MISEVKESIGCRKKIHVEVERERFESEVLSTLKEVKRDVLVPGFRKGHAPDALILRRFRASVEEEALRGMIPKVVKEVLAEKGINPVGEPILSDLKMDEGAPLTFELVVDELPAIDIGGFEGLDVKKMTMDVIDEEIDASLERLRRSRAVQNEVDREVRQGDIIVANLQKLDAGGVPIIGEKMENHVLHLDGNGTPSPEFDKRVAGMLKGERRAVTFTYDDTIENPQLAGTSESYDVEILRVFENTVPEIDDDFAKGLGKFSNLAELRENIRTQIAERNAYLSSQRLRFSFVDEFVRQNPFEVPASMVDKIIDSEWESYRKSHPDDAVDEDGFRSKIRPDAVRSVQTYLIEEAVKKEKGIKVDREEVNARVEAIAVARGVNPKELRRKYIKEGRLDSVRDDIARERVYDWMESVAKITGEIMPRDTGKSNIIIP